MKTLSLLKSLFLLSLLFIYSGHIFSQRNQWTWIKGDNTINQPGVYGTVGIPVIANKPGARGESISWKDKSGKFWLFGGIGYGSTSSSGQLNDLWKYDNTTNNWVWAKGPLLPGGNGVYGTKGIASPNNIPGARGLGASWTDNAGNLWLFGGAGNTYFNDLWKYDIAINQWVWVNGDNSGNASGIYGTQGIASSTNKPGARINAVCWTDNTNNLWLYGGNGYAASGPGGKLGDLWKYDIGNNTWTWIKGDSVIKTLSVYGTRNTSAPTNKPGSRMGASGWTDESGNLWMFGGLGYASVYGVLNDLWKYNITANEWVWENGDSTVGHPAVYSTSSLIYVTARPGGMHNTVTWSDANGTVWLFGGRGYTDAAFGELNSLWQYNMSTNQWTFIKGDHSTFVAGDYGILGVPAETNKPGSREKPVAWTDSLGNLWMFGGEGYPLNTTITYYQSDLWKFSLTDILPVKLVSFDGKWQDKNILLNWVVENELDFDHYEIEKSFNGSVFETAGNIKATNKGYYDFTDYGANQQAISYYRLKMVDIDGKFSYSNVISFHGQQVAGFMLHPNPANAYTQLDFNKNIHGKIAIEIVGADGRVVLKNTFNVIGNRVIISTNALSNGIYTITVTYNAERFVQNLLIVK